MFCHDRGMLTKLPSLQRRGPYYLIENMLTFLITQVAVFGVEFTTNCNVAFERVKKRGKRETRESERGNKNIDVT